MRTILFRGKHINNFGWLVGDLLQWKDGSVSICTNEHGDSKGKFEVVPDSVGQFTGLRDLCGNMIFEGDILEMRIPDGSKRRFLVKWARQSRMLKELDGFEHNGNEVQITGWCFSCEGHNLYPSVIDGKPDNERMRIIGNKYDNPELLNE